MKQHDQEVFNIQAEHSGPFKNEHIQGFNSPIFISCLTVFLLFLAFQGSKSVSGWFQNVPGIQMILGVFALLAALWLASQAASLLSAAPYRLTIQSVTSLVIVLFFAYQLCTPYFYPDSLLQRESAEKVEQYFQLGGAELSIEERAALTSEIFSESTASVINTYGHFPTDILIDVNITKIDRTFSAYTATAVTELKSGEGTEFRTYDIRLLRQDGEFKIEGFSVAEEAQSS